MRVLLANPRGFCAGVSMAIECVNRVLELKGPPIYVFHDIVHNQQVVQDFQKRGVTFVNDIAQVPQAAVVVYSAHGISPEVRRAARQRQLVEIDATCPLVSKVHLEVLRFARDGYTIIFVGHRGHDEALGTAGEAPHPVVIVEKPDEVAGLRVRDETKVAYVTQTTLSLHDSARIIEALRTRWPHIQGPAKQDICYATTNRQNTVSALSAEVDVVLVIGSAHSSNSLRLVETAQAAGKPAYRIDNAAAVQMAWLEGRNAVLVTSGASVPEPLVQELLERLKREFGAQVEERSLVEEDVSFALPRSLKSLAVLR